MVRKHVGRLLIVAAGGGCLAALIFVVLPMMNEPAPTMTQDATVAAFPGVDETAGDESEIEAAAPMPPLVGARNDGENVAVAFPASEAAAASEESTAEDDGLLQVLSADDVAAARAALEGRDPEPVEPVEGGVQDKAEESQALPVIAGETGGPAGDDGGEEIPAASAEPEAPAVVEAEAPETAGEEMTIVPERAVAAVVLPAGSVRAEGRDRPGNEVRLAVRRGEFDMPVFLGPRALRDVSHPSGGVPALAAQAGNAPSGLPPRTVRAGMIVPGTLRGVMGYRLPLVSRQEVPDQIVSGVLIPAHTTFVIVKQGAWELIDLTAEEVQALREAAAREEREAAAEAEAEKGARPWTLWRALRGRRVPAPE